MTDSVRTTAPAVRGDAGAAGQERVGGAGEPVGGASEREFVACR